MTIKNMEDWEVLNMQYIPDTYIKDSRVDNDTFLELQYKYREGFLKYLSTIINFGTIDEEIKKYDVDIPVLDDQDCNFYHCNSPLGSNYLYLRNNIHLERLDDEELKHLAKGEEDINYYVDTYQKVLYEDGDLTSYGIYPNDMNTVKSKALIFEFAYDQTQTKSVDDLLKTKKCYEDIFSFINDKLSEKNIDVDFLVYQGIPRMFAKEEKEATK
jgi:hypothetical protein